MSANLSFLTDPEAALASYHELGYHIETGLWTEEELAKINAAADTLPSFLDGTFAPVMQPHRVHTAFHNALCHSKLVGIMERLVSGPVSGIQSQLFYCRPGTKGFSRHQDNQYVEAGTDAFASAWTALQDVTVENGCLIVYPGTHREPILPVEACPSDNDKGQDPNANRQQAVLPDNYKGVDVPVKRGSVLFLHGHTVHSSHQNCSTGFRRALLMTYVRKGSPFRPGNLAKRAEVDVYA